MEKEVRVKSHKRFGIWRSGLPIKVQRELYKKELEREFGKDVVDWRSVKYLQRGLRMCEAQMKTQKCLKESGLKA